MAASYQSQALTGLRPAEEGFQLGREAALTAIETDPDYAPAYDSLGFIAQYYDADLAQAAKYYQRALSLAPANAGIIGSAGMLLQNMGRLQQGLTPIEFTVASDPLSAGWRYTVGLAYLAVGRFENAVESFETTLELSPDFSLGHYNLGVALMLDDRPGEGVAVLEQEPREDWRLTGLAMAMFAEERQRANDSDGTRASDRVLAELLEKYADSMAYNIAYLYAYRDEKDAAFQWLEKAVEVQDAGLGAILSERLFLNLHDDPRWLPFLKTQGKSPAQLADIELAVSLPQS